MNQIEILSGFQNTAPFLADVREAADSDKGALGFFAKGVFNEFARRDNLFVMIERADGAKQYVGHLLFECRYPRAHVRQMFIKTDYRRSGLAAKLITHLCEVLTNQSFTSVYARVAEDLSDANSFWGSQNFYVQRVVKGGVTTGRQINVRCRELASPQLFPASGIDANNPLGLVGHTSEELPLYLLDLNVLFDLGPRRLRTNDVVRLFRAERMNLFKLAISDEIHNELERTKQEKKTDPMAAYISIYPSFPLLKNDALKQLIDNLAQIVFPEKKTGQLTVNDRSDINHVATAIQHGLAGLITSDGALLDAASTIRSRYGIDVMSLDSFVFDDAPFSRGNSEFETSKSSTLQLQEVVENDEKDVSEILVKLGLTGSAISTTWLHRNVDTRIARRYVIRGDTRIIGYLTWSSKNTASFVSARAVVDESHALAFDAARILVRYLLDQLAGIGPLQVGFITAPRQSYLREIATGAGFRGTPNQNSLSKIILGRVLTVETWDVCRAQLADSGGVKLPVTIPSYTGPNQQIRVLAPNGNQIHLTLDELESLVSPALFCLPGRPAVITPVIKSFSEPLLGHSQQMSLLPQAQVSLFQERHFLSGPRALKSFKRGGLMLFYESTREKGRAAIVAIARVRQAYLKADDSLGTIDYERSVLTPSNLATIGRSKLKSVAVFDNIFTLPRQVSMTSLKRIGCGAPNDLITTKSISDMQLRAILREAFDLAQ